MIVSPDGTLRLVVRGAADARLSFHGFPWHTHLSVIQASSAGSSKTTVDRFVVDLVAGNHIIALSVVAGGATDVWITDDPTKEERYRPPGEHIHFRPWDGTTVHPGNHRAD